MTPDPRWLELLKASGFQTGAVAVACATLLFLGRWEFFPPFDTWVIYVLFVAMVVCASLALASLLSTFFQMVPLHTFAIQALNRRNERIAIEQYIPFMTTKEKEIIGYLLAKNQKIFAADDDGGYAAPLISRGIVRVAARPGQIFDLHRVPMGIPDHIWKAFARRRDEFPYTPPQDGNTDKEPWRVSWMAR